MTNTSELIEKSKILLFFPLRFSVAQQNWIFLNFSLHIAFYVSWQNSSPSIPSRNLVKGLKLLKKKKFFKVHSSGVCDSPTFPTNLAPSQSAILVCCKRETVESQFEHKLLFSKSLLSICTSQRAFEPSSFDCYRKTGFQ